MNDMPDDEKMLRHQLLDMNIPEPPAVEKILEATVRQANMQTGARDLLILAISSFFAFLLVLCAPIATASAAQKKRLLGTIKSRLTINNF